MRLSLHYKDIFGGVHTNHLISVHIMDKADMQDCLDSTMSCDKKLYLVYEVMLSVLSIQ